MGNWKLGTDDIGETIEEFRTWDSLELEIRYSKSTHGTTVDTLVSRPQKVEVRNVDAGGFRGIDLSVGDNTLTLNAPTERELVRPVDTFLLEDYERTVISKGGDVYELSLSLVPKTEKAFDNTYGTSISNISTPTRSSNQWKFDFHVNSIVTKRVTADIEDAPEGTKEVYNLDMILEPEEVRIFEENLSYLNLVSLKDVPDNQDVAVDFAQDNRGTIQVTQPDGTDSIIPSTVVALSWETEWLGGAYRVSWELVEQG